VALAAAAVAAEAMPGVPGSMTAGEGRRRGWSKGGSCKAGPRGRAAEDCTAETV
jgi:hypothetical protein